MLGPAQKTARRPRAWWQWLLGISLLAAAGGVAVCGYVPGLFARRSVAPREIVVSPDLRPADALPAGPGDLAGSNLLLVTFDTTRADRIGCYGNREIETPAIDRLSREGVLFSDVTTTSPTTLPSHCSIMTGLYPFHHGARANNTFHLDEDQWTLAEVLADQGFATAAFVSAFVLDSQFGLDQGFRVYDDDFGEQEPTMLTEFAERTADQTTRRAETWLREHGQERFFLWVHYYDPHSSYDPPEPFRGRFAFAYDGEIAFADSQLGSLLGVLDEMKLTDGTLVVVAGDHGEGLGQHGEPAHGTLIYQSTMQVPMVMRCGKRLGSGVHVSRPVSLVDVMPTVLALLGIPGPADMDGLDLSNPQPESRTLFVETLQGLADYGWAALLGARQGSMKYIYGPDTELYDLTVDPFEDSNLSGSRTGPATSMRQQLAAFFGGDLEKAASAAPTHQLSAADLARLQSLGYLASGTPAPQVSRPHPRDMTSLLTEVNTAISAERQEGLDAVIRRLEQIADRHPDLVAAHIYLAAAWLKKGDLDRAERAYARCMELRPGEVTTYMLLAHLKIRQRKPDEAALLFEGVLELSPEHFEALDQLGRMRLSQGRFDDAVELLTRALEVRPRDQSLPDVLASALLSLDRADDAVSLFRRLLADDPQLAMVRNTLAGILRDRGQAKEAVALLREGIELDPQELMLVNNLAFILATTAGSEEYRPIEAALMMERVCKETGYKDPRYLHTLSLTYATRMRLDEAMAIAEKARSIAAASEDPRFSALAPAIGQSLQQYKMLKEQGIPAGAPPPDAPALPAGETDRPAQGRAAPQ